MKALKERDHLRDVDADGSLILKMNFTELERKAVDWIQMAMYSDEYFRASMNTELKPWFSRK